MIDRARSEHGFTLIELLVASVLLVVVLMATLTALDTSKTLATRDTERAHAVAEARTGLDRLLRELRHAQTVTARSPTSLTVTIARRGTITAGVTFDCGVSHPTLAGTKRCVRRVGGSEEVLVDMVKPQAGDPDIFQYTLAGTVVRHVAIRLPIRLDGGRTAGGYTGRAILRDGTELRNG